MKWPRKKAGPKSGSGQKTDSLRPTAWSAFASCGIWPALPITGYWLLYRAVLDPGIRLPGVTAFALCAASGVMAWSLPMLGAAIAGIFRPTVIGIAGWITTAAFIAYFACGTSLVGSLPMVFSPWDALLLGVLLIAACLYLGFPTETLLYENDAGVYANHAVFIARHGRLDIPYPWASEPDTEFVRAFQTHCTVDDSFFEDHLFPGFFKTGKTITVQFAHLGSIWLAQAFASFGPGGLFRLNGVFALLTLGVFYGLCLGLVPAPVAVAATLFLALNPAQLWMARITLSEILTQLLLWSGSLLLIQALRFEQLPLACWAGGFFGLAAFVRCDVFLLAPLLFISQLLTHVVAPDGSTDAGPWAALNAVTLPLMLLSIIYLWLFSRPYFQKNVRIQLAGIGIATVVSLGALLVVGPEMCQRVRPWATSPVSIGLACLGLLALASYGYWLRPRARRFVLDLRGHPYFGMRYHAEKSMLHLAQYLSVPGLWLGLAGWCITLFSAVDGRQEPWLLPLLVVSAGYSVLYLYDPADDPFHFWVMRRYIPVVLPAFVLFAAVSCSWLLGKLPEPWPTIGAAALIGCVAIFTIRTGDVLLCFAERKGAFAQLERIAREIPGDEIILANASPDLLTPLCVSFGKLVIPIDLSGEDGQALVAAWVSSRLQMGKPAYLLQQAGSDHLPPRTTELARGWISFSYLKPSVRPLPRRLERKCIPVALQRIDGLPQPADYLDVPLERGFLVGTKATGFHREELFEGEPARWTNGAAKIIVPVHADCPPRALIVDIAWSGPHAPDLQVIVNGRHLSDVTIPRQQSWSARLDLSDIPIGEQLIIELLSDTFQGFEQWAPGEDRVPDRRQLGVLVRGIRLTGELDYFAAGLERGAIWGSKILGFLSQECIEGRPCRWTNGRGKVAIPLDPKYPPGRGLEIELTTSNPQGTELRLRTNGRELCRDRLLPETLWSKTVLFPEGFVHGQWLVIELLSDTFVPKEAIQGAIDERRLGVLVRKIGLTN